MDRLACMTRNGREVVEMCLSRLNHEVTGQARYMGLNDFNTSCRISDP